MKMVCRKVTFIIVGLLALALGAEQAASDQIGCVQAITSLMPCQPFLTGASNSVTAPCCEAAAGLSRAVGSDRAEMKSLCYCFKQAIPSMGVNQARAKQLPQLCHVAVPVPIDPSVNCDTL